MSLPSYWRYNELTSKHDTDLKYFSISKNLKLQNKISEEFEVMLNQLSLEEIIALKLELGSKALGGKLFGFSFWKILNGLTKDAILKYAFSACVNKFEAMTFIGLNHQTFKKYIYKYKILQYFRALTKHQERMKLSLDKIKETDLI